MNSLEIRCICENMIDNEILIRCTKCKLYQHIKCIGHAGEMKIYECHYCQLKSMDLYMTTLEFLSKPILINNLNQSNIISFTYDKQKLLTNSNNKKFIFIKCLKLDEFGFQHHWPLNCTLLLNSKLIKTFEVPKNHLLSKQRIDHPIVFYESDILDNYHNLKTGYCMSAENLFTYNNFNLVNNPKLNRADVYSYVLSVELVEITRNVENLLASVEKIYNKEIYCDMIEWIKISLINCYDGKRIRLPGRGSLCKHENVFDIEQFLIITRKNRRYICPLCGRRVPKLYLDLILSDMIDKHKDKDEIYIDKNLLVVHKIENISKESDCVLINLLDDNLLSIDSKDNTSEKTPDFRFYDDNKITVSNKISCSFIDIDFLCDKVNTIKKIQKRSNKAIQQMINNQIKNLK